MNGYQFRHHAERGQRHNVNLGMAKKPKEMLKEQWTATAMFQRLTERHDGRHEEAGPNQFIHQHHDRADKKSRNREQAKDGRHHNAPDV